jgi:DNA-binding CsgD family transcriptional regulator
MMRVAGRNAELTAVERALDGVGAGFSAIIISGEPGIGKTTMWRYGIAGALARGYRVASCHPAGSEKCLSFCGLADLLEQVPAQALDRLPDPQREALEVALLKRTAPQTDADRRAISTAVTSLVRGMAATRPVVVAVDDMQWLDTATAEVLAYMSRRLSSEPVLFLGASRNSPGEAPSALGQALDADQVTRVPLGPLAAHELHELIRDRAQLSMARPGLLRLHEASGGNPLFAIEIAKTLPRFGSSLMTGEPLPVPEPIAALVAQRISALPEPTRAALLIASALTHPTAEQVRAVVTEDGRLRGAAEGLLRNAEENGVVEIRDGLIRFTHPLFRSVLYFSASEGRRRRIHRSLAGIVCDIEERAWHMALGVPGPDQDAAEALEKAARVAHERGAADAAARLWELASHRTPATDPGERSRRMVAAAELQFRIGDTGRARSMLESVIEGMSAGLQRGYALLWLATVLSCERSPAAAAIVCRNALAEAGTDRFLRALLHMRAAEFTEGDASARVADAEAAAAILDGDKAAASPDSLACALLARGYYRFLAGLGTGSDDVARAGRLLSSDGRSWEWARARDIMCQWMKSQDITRAYLDYRAECKRAAERDDMPAVAGTLFHLTEIECWLGHWQQAKVHAAEAAAAFEQIGQARWRSLILYIKALPDAYLGEAAAAGAAAERGLEIATSDQDPNVAALHLGLLGFTALSQGEFGTADRYLSRADEIVSSMGLAEPATHRFHGDHLEAVLACADLDRAVVLQRRLEDRARLAPYPWLNMIVTSGRAMLEAAQGNLDAAAHSAEQALKEAQAAAMPFEHGRTLLTAGQIRRRRKEKLLAREAFQHARQIFENLQTPLWAARATAEIRRLGLRSNSSGSMTPAEERVAHLVADGLTNREVAGALFISQKTVEANLSRIFRKLGIRSRRELIAQLASLPLPGARQAITEANRASGPAKVRTAPRFLPGNALPSPPVPRRR